MPRGLAGAARAGGSGAARAGRCRAGWRLRGRLRVPEIQAALDALLSSPGIAGPAGYTGGVTAMGVRLALVEPRIAAVGLFAGSVIPRATMAEARAVTVPVHALLQWDDEGNDRQAALELFDGLGSREKTLVANVGGHTGVPTSAGDDAAHFFRRHLTRITADDAATPREDEKRITKR